MILLYHPVFLSIGNVHCYSQLLLVYFVEVFACQNGLVLQNIGTQVFSNNLESFSIFSYSISIIESILD
jgi:hypothetical protein